MLMWTLLALVTLLILGLLYPVFVYFRDPYNLRRFPSPSYAGLTSLWAARHAYNLQRSAKVHEAHQKLGSIVRIQPTHISFDDADAMVDIYGHNTKLMKDPFYDTFSGNEYKSIVGTRDRSEHARKRKLQAAAFAQKSIVDMEPVVQDKVMKLCNVLDKTSASFESTCNIRRWLNLFTFDVIGEMAFGESMDFLDQGNDNAPAETYEGKLYRTNAITAFHTNSRYDVVLAHWPGLLRLTKYLTQWHIGNVKGAEFTDICIRKIRARIEKQGTPQEPQYRDFFSHLLVDKKGDNISLPFRELMQEAGVMLNAGSDTTATAMTNCLYQLIRHPHVMRKLLEEIDPILGSQSTIADYDQVKTLRYLRACIDESMRDRPPTGLGLPRQTPKGGVTIAGHFLPEGITVSVPTYTFHHNSKLFQDPWEYKPERWLEGDTSSLKYAMPFSFGPRAW